MPAKNILKEYLEDGIYHIYNRGVEKRIIFVDVHDYKTFLYLLKTYLLPSGTDPEGRVSPSREKRNFHTRINLLCYCLMPNHFHILLKQKNKDDISEFMKCLATNYSMYFNKKYNRIGSLFQGRYKASLIQEDNHLLHVSRYIHLNPGKNKYKKYPFSSYLDYVNLRNTKWIQKNLILDYFSTKNINNDFVLLKNFSYEEFMNDQENDNIKLDPNLLLEN